MIKLWIEEYSIMSKKNNQNVRNIFSMSILVGANFL